MLLTLRAGTLELMLSPGIGGAVSRLTWIGGTDGGCRCCARPERRDDSVLDMASFPLVPYVNRIRGGPFTFRGREVVLQPNMAGDTSPLHGAGLAQCVDGGEPSDEHRAVLRFEHEAGEWPWAYEARQISSSTRTA